MKSRKKENMGYLYIAPWLIGFVVLTLYPFVVSFGYSFTNYDMFKMDFVGIRNYANIFQNDKTALSSLGKTLFYTAVSVPLKLFVALMVALMLNKIRRGRTLFYTIFYLPSILGSSVALAILWKYLFKKDGLVNLLLGAIGIQGENWLGNPSLALPVMMLLPLWQMGAPMVLFLAALKNVPQDLIEAAKIDGAKKVRIFFKITLPMMSPTIFFTTIMTTIASFKVFDQVFVMTNGGPSKASYMYVLHIYDYGFKQFKMGQSSTAAVIFFVLLLILTIIQNIMSKRWVNYET